MVSPIPFTLCFILCDLKENMVCYFFYNIVDKKVRECSVTDITYRGKSGVFEFLFFSRCLTEDKGGLKIKNM